MPRWLNNTLYAIIAIVSMGCTMQGIKWISNKPKEKPNDKTNKNGKYQLY